jgi:hypothetical protein
MNSAGSPAEVKAWLTPAPASTSTIDGSAFQPWIIRFAATGRSVNSRNPQQVLPALGGRRLAHAQAAGLGHGGGELGPRDVGHRRLHDGKVDAEQ